MKKIGVIGLGYVGLPLSLLADKKGFEVIGYDVDQNLINNLINRTSKIDDLFVADKLENNTVKFTNNISDLRNIEIAVVCVPTPVNNNKIPDLTLLKTATVNTAKFLKDGSLLIIESTINPGVCDEILVPLINKKTGHVVGKTIHLAHCPERINPGDPEWNVSNISRVLGANSKESLEIAKDFYEKLVDAKIKPMASLKEAEAVKVVENSFRDINIAFVNELAMSFQKLGINVVNVIDGAATKPFAFMPHYPGCGVGGHCIPVDPYYLIEYARGHGFEHSFLSLARKINEDMPMYAVNLLEKALKKKNLKISGSKVALLGLSYKPNVGDIRESPAISIKNYLLSKNVDVTCVDPHVNGQNTIELSQALKLSDYIIVATAHKEFEKLTPMILKDFGIKIIIDGRNFFSSKKSILNKFDIEYHGIGI